MHNGCVADRHVRAYHAGQSRIGMQASQILYIVRGPIETDSQSPRITAPNHTLECSPKMTLPTTVAVGAIQADDARSSGRTRTSKGECPSSVDSVGPVPWGCGELIVTIA